MGMAASAQTLHSAITMAATIRSHLLCAVVRLTDGESIRRDLDCEAIAADLWFTGIAIRSTQ